MNDKINLGLNYEWVPVKQELPPIGDWNYAVDASGDIRHLLHVGENIWLISDVTKAPWSHDDTDQIEYWLRKKEDSCVLSRSEFEKIISGAYSEGAWQEQDGHHARNTEKKMREDYIKELLK